MNISMDKKYTLRGEEFTLLTVAKPGRWPVVGYTPDGDTYELMANGSTITNQTTLVEVSPYADFVIGEPVMVRDRNTEQWWKRYFAGVDPEGNPLTFNFGNTKWSNAGEGNVNWLQCRRPTAEELAT